DHVQVGNETLLKVFDALQISNAARSLQGDIKTYNVEINHGNLKQDLLMTLGEHDRPLRLFGDVRLADKQMLPVTLDFPWTLFGVKEKALQKYLPAGVEIPLKGPVTKPRLALDPSFVQNVLAQAGQKALAEQAGHLLRGNDKGDKSMDD